MYDNAEKCALYWQSRFPSYFSKVNFSEVVGSRNQKAAGEAGSGSEAKDVEAGSVNHPF